MLEVDEVYSIAQIRALEEFAKTELSMDEFTLMELAGCAASNVLSSEWPNALKIIVFCGQGNNAGDGYVMARIAKERGLEVDVYVLGNVDKYSASAKHAYIQCREAGVPIYAYHAQTIDKADLLVDALLGIGIKGSIRNDYWKAIEAINRSNIPVFSLDVPSGLDAQTGSVLGIAIKAVCTLSFIALKPGLTTGDGLDYCGKLVVDTLNLKRCHQAMNPLAKLLSSTVVQKWLLPRRRNSYKGEFGHVLIIGGNKGMAGAARLAAESALKVGAGLVSVATYPGHTSTILSKYPEIMCHEMSEGGSLSPLLEKATVLVIGPGLGQDHWARHLFQQAIASPLPKVIDADGLNLLEQLPNCEQNWVLTPHPGEAAHLLGLANAGEVQKDRFSALKKLVCLGGIWVLKGAGTLIALQNEPIAICEKGNPGMASAGMGDVLSGVIGGLIAQGCLLDQAAAMGVLVHALAGDFAAQKYGERGLSASQVVQHIQNFVN